jgi:DNA-binding response OmpR family regulator
MKKILVVDDDIDILYIIRHLLRSKGFEVTTHSTGVGVPELVFDYKPDLILLDIQLPGKLGTEICKELKEAGTHIPILLFSAHADEEKTIAICHADGFIAKPFDISHLIDTIKFHVK